MNKILKVRAGGRSKHNEYGANNAHDVKRLKSCQNTSFIKTNEVKEVSARNVKERS